MLLHVMRVDQTTIATRRLLTGGDENFDPQTGRGDRCTLDSVAPLPADIHDLIYNLDRRQHLAVSVEELRLTRSEKEALLFIAKFYPTHPLPS